MKDFSNFIRKMTELREEIRKEKEYLRAFKEEKILLGEPGSNLEPEHIEQVQREISNIETELQELLATLDK